MAHGVSLGRLAEMEADPDGVLTMEEVFPAIRRRE
jgi:hypothetical protein